MAKRDDSKILVDSFWDGDTKVRTMTLEDGTVLDSRREGEDEKIKHEMTLSRQRWNRKKRTTLK